MHHPDRDDEPSGESALEPTQIPVDQRILEVYETAHVNVRSKILSDLVGKVYAAAPPATQKQLLKHLLRPLGLLSIAVVADGIFARMLSRGNWVDERIPIEEVQNVQPNDVVVLVEYVMQVSRDAVNGLAQLLMASPVMTKSAAATVLVTLLLQRASNRRHGDTARNLLPTDSPRSSTP